MPFKDCCLFICCIWVNSKKNQTIRSYFTDGPLLLTFYFSWLRFGVWEAAKWVARVRDLTIYDPKRPILLNLTADLVDENRYLQSKESALEAAFLIKMMESWICQLIICLFWIHLAFERCLPIPIWYRNWNYTKDEARSNQVLSKGNACHPIIFSNWLYVPSRQALAGHEWSTLNGCCAKTTNRLCLKSPCWSIMHGQDLDRFFARIWSTSYVNFKALWTNKVHNAILVLMMCVSVCVCASV